MFSSLNALLRPYYLLRPSQLLRRLRFEGGRWLGPAHPSAAGGGQGAPVRLPWGLTLRCDPAEEVGRALHTTGIYDLALSELLWRLTDPGDLTVDAGANLGYATSLLARRAGLTGRVLAFEPHPLVFARLEENVRRWREAGVGGPSLAPVNCLPLALSEREGTGHLRHADDYFAVNLGVASLDPAGAGSDEDPINHVPGTSVFVGELRRLDGVLPARTPIGVLKLDVEGHEAAVLAGAGALVGQTVTVGGGEPVRDIVFEEFRPYPAAGTHDRLEAAGYTVFHVEEFLLGPRLRLTAAGWRPPAGRPANYLATREADRARARFATRGWRCLGGDKQ